MPKKEKWREITGGVTPLSQAEVNRRAGNILNWGKLSKAQQHNQGEEAVKRDMAKNKKCEVIAHRKGYPDLTFRKNGRLIFVEVKTKKYKPDKNQRKVLKAFKKAGFSVLIAHYRPGKQPIKYENIK